MDQKFCQSCGMPINKKADFGTNKDQNLNGDYCIYCFKDGTFTQDYTMTEMIEDCLKYIDEFNKDDDKAYTIEQTRVAMQAYFPKLKP